MSRILIYGAGRSAFYTVQYLLQKETAGNLQVTVVDSSEENLLHCTAGFPNAARQVVDVHNVEQRQTLIARHDIVISLLPAALHQLIAEDCLILSRCLITPSYISPEMKALEDEVKAKGLTFLCELGLDPGIDHMSAMKLIAELKSQNAEIYSFRSYTGGIPAKVSNNNPWQYKISWNPYNVIRAGQDGGLFLSDHIMKFKPYHRIFSECKGLKVKNETFDTYINRNSIPYIEIFGLQDVTTFVRGTIRYDGFCRIWNILIALGLTSDKVKIKTPDKLLWTDFLSSFPENNDEKADVWARIRKMKSISLNQVSLNALQWLFEDEFVSPGEATPAEKLQILIEKKWKMSRNDKDRVVMVHEIRYRLDGGKHQVTAVLDIDGEDATRTAMAKTVGLPLAIAAELLAKKRITAKGILLPIIPEVYEPVLNSLAENGIIFNESYKDLSYSSMEA